MPVSKIVLGLVGAAAVAGVVTVAVVASSGGKSAPKAQATSSSSSVGAGAAADRASTSSSVATATTPVTKPLPDPSCEQEPSVKSITGTTPFNLTFVNNTAETVQALWINYDGQRVLYRQIPAGSSYVQATWITHPWVVADLDGTCLTLYVVDGHQDTVTVPVGSTAPATSVPIVDAGTDLGNAAVVVQANDALVFSPVAVDASRNAIVEWDNVGTIEHNVTFDDAAHASLSDLHLTAGGKWQARFATAGTFTYTCTLHPDMTGSVVIH